MKKINISQLGQKAEFYYESGELLSEGNGEGVYKEYYNNLRIKEEIDEDGNYKHYEKIGEELEKINLIKKD